MNKEDYNTFRTHFSAIWEFIERNAVIYPPQTTREVIQEEQPLFTQQIANENYEYLFDSIINVQTLNEIDYSKCSNLNEWIKKYLDHTEGYYYDAHRYMQLPMNGINRIPNPSLDKKSILEQYATPSTWVVRTFSVLTTVRTHPTLSSVTTSITLATRRTIRYLPRLI